MKFVLLLWTNQYVVCRMWNFVVTVMDSQSIPDANFEPANAQPWTPELQSGSNGSNSSPDVTGNENSQARSYPKKGKRVQN